MKNSWKDMFKKVAAAILSAVLLLSGAVVALPQIEGSGITANAAGSSFDNPMDIKVNQNYTDRITDWDDKDYYKFTLTSDAKVSVDFSHNFIDSSSSYWKLIIYTNNNANDEIYSCYFQGNKKSQRTVSLGLPKGSYFILIQKCNYSDINYTFKVNATVSNNWEKELNDVFETATNISVNQQYYGSIKDYSDTDFYKFKLNSDSKVTINFQHSYIDSSSSYWQLRLYKDNNSNDEIYYCYFEGNNKSQTTASLGLPKGTYYLRINKSNFIDIDYKFKIIAVSTTNWEKESNNVFETATPIAINTFYNGSIKDYGDVDFYKFTLKNKTTVKINFKHSYIDSSGSYWYLRIFKENNTNSELYSYYFDGNQSSVNTDNIILPKGNYYIRIQKSNYTDIDYSFKVVNISAEKSVKLNKTSATLAKGKSVQLTANQSVTWSTSNSSKATVKNGKVTAKKVGTVTITAKAKNGKKATCKVTVKNLPTKVKLNKTKATIKKGKTLTLKATVTPSTNVISTVKWTSSNKNIATVNSKGKITAKKAGTVTITVKTTNGKTAKCKITVKK